MFGWTELQSIHFEARPHADLQWNWGGGEVLKCCRHKNRGSLNTSAPPRKLKFILPFSECAAEGFPRQTDRNHHPAEIITLRRGQMGVSCPISCQQLWRLPKGWPSWLVARQHGTACSLMPLAHKDTQIQPKSTQLRVEVTDLLQTLEWTRTK